MQRFAKFKKILWRGFTATLNFRKFRNFNNDLLLKVTYLLTFLLTTYMAPKVEKFKRKTHIERIRPAWRSESISSEEDSLSPLAKKVKSKDHMESEF